MPLEIRRATRADDARRRADGHVERVVVSALSINRDPTSYPEPPRLGPARWAAIRPSPFQYTVFGAGGHMCPGITFGLQMMKIALATILSP